MLTFGNRNERAIVVSECVVEYAAVERGQDRVADSGKKQQSKSPALGAGEQRKSTADALHLRTDQLVRGHDKRARLWRTQPQRIWLQPHDVRMAVRLNRSSACGLLRTLGLDFASSSCHSSVMRKV